VTNTTTAQASRRQGANAADDARPTDSYLGYRLVKAAMRIRTRTTQALAPLQLTPQDFGLLNQVIAQPGLTQARLGSCLGIDRTTVVALLDHLTNMGWIEREADSTDRRIYRIAATASGRQTHRRAMKVVMEVEAEFTAPLGKADRIVLDKALGALVGGEAPP
jgi:DNA-binding MarR family transcriptional regulator